MSDYFEYVESLFKNGEKREQPLKGIKVVEVTHYIFGPNVGRVLAQFGAEVVKIEPVGEGDRMRMGAVWGRFYKKANLQFLALNANKYLISADVRRKKAREIVFKLAEKADVFVENLRAGLADAMGIGYSTISRVNPKIVYVSCSGYGQWGGRLIMEGSFDIAAQAVTSIGTKTGWEEVDEFYKLPDYFGDFLPSQLAVFAVLAALYYREKTGKGQYIDISQAEGLFRFLYDVTYLSLTSQEIGKTGNIDPTASPSGIFKTKDEKFVAIAIMDDDQFSALASVVEGLKGKEKGRLKKERIKELNKILSEWVSTKTLEEVINLSKELGFPASPVLGDYDIYKDPWRYERGSILKFKDRLYGEVVIPGPVVNLSDSPGEIKWLARPVGYHNRFVLKKWLGLTDEEIDELEKEGVIGYWDNIPGCMPPATWDKEKDRVFWGDEDER